MSSVKIPIAILNGRRPMPDTGVTIIPVGAEEVLPDCSAAGSGIPEPRAYGDLIPRPRDARGNRLPLRYVYHLPYPEDVPLAETPLRAVVEEIGRVRSAQAAYAEAAYETARRAGRRARQVRDEAESQLLRWNTETEAWNREIDEQQQTLHERAAAAARPHREAADRLRPEVERAHQVAYERAAAIGRPYDRMHPSVEPLLAVATPVPSAVAARENLPNPEGDPGALMKGWLVWTMTALVGSAVGVSLGLASGILQPDTLARHLPEAGLAALVGTGIAAFCRKGIVLLHRQASERSYLRRPWSERWAWLLGALAFDAAVTGLDLLVEREGLLRLGRLSEGVSALSGDGAAPAGEPFVWWLIPAIMTLGYCVYAAVEGYLDGRRGPLRDRLAHAAEREARAASEAWAAREDVRAAVAAVGEAAGLQSRLEMHREEAEQTEVPFLARVRELESQRRGILPALTEEQRRRIQDAEDDARGATTEFVALLARELARLEPGRER